MDQRPLVVAALVNRISSDLTDRLRVATPDLLTGGLDAERLHARVEAVVSLTLARLDPAAATPPLAPDVGAVRARSNIHPSRSLSAADELFRAALPALVDHARRGHGPIDDGPIGVALPTGGPPAGVGDTEVAIALHGAINDLVVPAAVSYVDVLLERVSLANADERARVARDLHDGLGPRVFAARAGVERATHLLGHPGGPGGVLDAEDLRGVAALLTETLLTIQQLAGRLREGVGARDLDVALRALLDAAIGNPTSVQAKVCSSGAVADLPGHVKEEVYLVLAEAVRNALTHAGGLRMLVITLTVEGGTFLATVADDGRGFDLAAAETVGHTGLRSMRERTEGLGGRWEVRPGPEGVVVELQVPVPVAGVGR